jgi:hypothetical protein
MSDAPTLSPELSRSVLVLARTLVAAARSWALYPPEHPAVGTSLDHLRAAIREAGGGDIFSFGVTPDTLIVAGVPIEGREPAAIAEAAKWLHERDVLQLGFFGDVETATLRKLLGVLSVDPHLVRQRGGPARVWADEGNHTVSIDQIDFGRVLADRDEASPIRRKDDIWRSIVNGVLDRRSPTDEPVQKRLLEIAGDVAAINGLAEDVIAPHHTPDGSPMLTSQAAAVVAAYRHLVGIVEVLSPERRSEVMQNLGSATANLNPHVVMQMFATSGNDASGAMGDAGTRAVVSGVIDGMDDTRVAQLLATTLAIEGQASARLARVFNTIAPDSERKSRVLSLTRRFLAEADFGHQDAFASLWSSMEELLLTYNERPIVSASYRSGLDGISDRAETLATDVPADLMPLIDTLKQENVRRLSVILLTDLLKLERDASRAPELARDVAALVEDLLLAGDYESARSVVTALHEQAADPTAVAGHASRVALDGVVMTAAFHETADLLGEMTAEEAACFADMSGRIGPAAADALGRHFEAEALTPARERATTIVRQYGARAVTRLAPIIGSGKWAAQRNVAELLGEIGAPEAVPLLQPLLRGQDGRVTSAAVRALAGIKDPAAARAVHTALRAASGEQRRAVVDALVAQRDPRVVPLLVRILEDSDPFGADHAIVLETLAALSTVGDDQAVPALSAIIRKKKFFGGSKVKAVREKGLGALRAINTPKSMRVIEDAATAGDRMLRKLARAGA